MVQELFPILSTSNLPRALGFYRDLLGGEVTYQFPAAGEPQYVSLRLGGSSLGLSVEPRLTSGRPEDVDAPVRFTLWAYVDDCDATAERLRAAGAPVLQEPADQPWGERMAVVADPDGNRVIVASR